MKAVHIAGRGLACALGLDVATSLATLRDGGATAESRLLPGGLGGDFPYYAIPYGRPDWHERARDLVLRVADEAGARPGGRGALFIATSSFDIGAVEPAAARTYAGDYRAFAATVAGWLAWSGPVYSISTACTSSLNALIAAQAVLNSGTVDEALVLGIELENCLTLGGFAALQLLSRSGSKPFGVHRDGLVLGEAVAALRLSTSTSARWKILGGANVVDGRQSTGASAAAIERMYGQALATAGLAAGEVDLVKVQAAGSPGNDLIEANGLRAAFDRLPPLVSLKGALGHTMGASGVAEIALLTACLEHGAWPRYADVVDETLGVKLATEAPNSVRRLLATVLGFGGSHTTVVLEHA